MKQQANRWNVILQNHVVVLVLALVFAVPLLFSGPPAHRSGQLAVYGFLGLLLLVVWLFGAQDTISVARLRSFVTSGPNLPLALYGAWSLLSIGLSYDRNFSQIAFIQLAMGLLVYGMVVYQFRHRTQVKALIASLLGVGVLLVLGAFVLDAERHLMDLAGSYHDRQLFGAFLMLLLPVLMGVAAGTRHRWGKIAAQGGALLVAAGLLLTRCRSAWVALAVALIAFALLSIHFVWAWKGLARRKHQLLVAPLLAVAVLGIFLGFTRVGGAVRYRAATFSALQEDASVVDRFALWKVAGEAIQARFSTGWGIGTYPLVQARFNPDSNSEAAIRRTGPSLNENPHNLYLQIGAELGLVGLAFYLAILVLFFRYGLAALPRMDRGLRQFTLIGCMAAVAGQCVDAFANPGWVFPEVSTFFWLVLGIGMRAAGLAQEAAAESAATQEPVLGVPRFLYRGARTALIGCTAVLLGTQILNLKLIGPAAAQGSATTPQYISCPQSQGYWGTHPGEWPVSTMTLGTQSYNKDELLALLNASKTGDASLILCQQLIAAKLNVAGVQDPKITCTQESCRSYGDVNQVIAAGDSLLAQCKGKLPGRIKTSTSLGGDMTCVGTILDSYNNAQATEGCGSCSKT